MYTAMMIILSVSIVGQIVESWLVFRKMKGALHGYLFFSCISTIVSIGGYILELNAKTEEAYITALKFSYIGRVWLCMMLFLFIAGLCRIELSSLLKTGLGILHIFIYLTVFTLEHHELYYKNCRFSVENGMAKYVHNSGIVHDIYTVMLIAMSITALIMLCISIHRERSKAARKRYLMVILAISAECIFIVIQLMRLIPFTNVVDLTIIGYPLITLFMSIAILRYGLMDTEEMAKEFMTDKLSEGIIAVDVRGKVQYINEPAERLYPDLRLYADRIPSELSRALKNGTDISIKGRIYSPEENELVKNGESCGRIYTLIDETEHYRYMSELENQKRLADSANKAKSAFLANMSHDIRTPINAVLGMNEMILRECDDDSILTYSRRIHSAGKTLLGLINDILDLSKIEAGKLDIIPVDYDLTSVLSDLVNMVQLRADAKGLEFRTQIDSGIPRLLHGDEIRLKQIITNILTNAVKYTEKGWVTFSVSYERAEENNILLKVSVADTGIGIKKTDIPKLFSEFDRIEEERNRGIEGTGLGMNITRRLLSMMDSTLCVESEYNKGSVFSFDLIQPVVEWEPVGDIQRILRSGAYQRTGYHESFTAPDARILVVDDTPMNLEVFTNLLKRTLMKIDTADSGDKCIGMASVKKYDIIFLDHMMPGKDGIETLGELKAVTDGVNAHTPVVCLTANAVSGSREMYLKEGFDNYLTKPIVPEKLEEMIIGLLPGEKVKAAVHKNGKKAADPLIPDFLYDIKEIDVNKGIRNCGGRESYIQVLTTYADSALRQCKEIEDHASSDDISSMTIKVHALKSTSRVIGAGDIGDLAERLEAAGHDGDMDIINKDLPLLIEGCRELIQKLSPLTKKSPLPLISDKELREAYTLISEFLSVEDYESTLGVIETLKNYTYPPDEQQRCLALIDASREYDYVRINNILK